MLRIVGLWLTTTDKCRADAFNPKAVLAARALSASMSDTALIVSGMNEPPNRYDVTVTVARDGGHLADPAEFAVGTAHQQARRRRQRYDTVMLRSSQAVRILVVRTDDTLDHNREQGITGRPVRQVSAGQLRLPGHDHTVWPMLAAGRRSHLAPTGIPANR
jgi:hypothetical protein